MIIEENSLRPIEQNAVNWCKASIHFLFVWLDQIVEMCELKIPSFRFSVPLCRFGGNFACRLSHALKAAISWISKTKNENLLKRNREKKGHKECRTDICYFYIKSLHKLLLKNRTEVANAP